MTNANRPSSFGALREPMRSWRIGLGVLLVVSMVHLLTIIPSALAQATPPAPAPAATPAKPEAVPTAPAATSKPDAKSPAVAGTPATIVDEQQIESLLGKRVESATGEDMGRIVDVLAEKTGQMRAAVIDFGGFLGVGSRKIAVDWRSLRFPADKKADKVIVDLPLNQLRVAPVYKEGEPVVVLGPAAAGVEAKPVATEPAPAAK